MNDEQESSHSVGLIAISFLVAGADYAIHPAPGRQTCAQDAPTKSRDGNLH
jgi:hypothetical protein